MITEATSAPTLRVAVIVHHSDLEKLGATLRCLAGALRHAIDAGSLGAVRVVVLDNGSGAEYGAALAATVEACAANFPVPLQLCRGERNLGYGGGVNAALATACFAPVDNVPGEAPDSGGAGDSYLLVLNPDIELAEDALAAGLRHLSAHADVVCVAPRCQRGNGEPEYLCKRYPAVFDLLLRGMGPLRRLFDARMARYEYRDLSLAAPAAVELVSGACMLVRRREFERVGGFDDGYFMYFEDFDLSLRLGSSGRLLFAPDMLVVHHGGNAARKGWRHVRWFAASALRFYRLHGWRWR